jgi:hypothetical protein
MSRISFLFYLPSVVFFILSALHLLFSVDETIRATLQRRILARNWLLAHFSTGKPSDAQEFAPILGLQFKLLEE